MTFQNAKAVSASIQTVAFASNGGVQSVGFDGVIARTPLLKSSPSGSSTLSKPATYGTGGVKPTMPKTPIKPPPSGYNRPVSPRVSNILSEGYGNPRPVHPSPPIAPAIPAAGAGGAAATGGLATATAIGGSLLAALVILNGNNSPGKVLDWMKGVLGIDKAEDQLFSASTAFKYIHWDANKIASVLKKLTPQQSGRLINEATRLGLGMRDGEKFGPKDVADGMTAVLKSIGLDANGESLIKPSSPKIKSSPKSVPAPRPSPKDGDSENKASTPSISKPIERAPVPAPSVTSLPLINVKYKLTKAANAPTVNIRPTKQSNGTIKYEAAYTIRGKNHHIALRGSNLIEAEQDATRLFQQGKLTGFGNQKPVKLDKPSKDLPKNTTPNKTIDPPASNEPALREYLKRESERLMEQAIQDAINRYPGVSAADIRVRKPKLEDVANVARSISESRGLSATAISGAYTPTTGITRPAQPAIKVSDKDPAYAKDVQEVVDRLAALGPDAAYLPRKNKKEIERFLDRAKKINPSMALDRVSPNKGPLYGIETAEKLIKLPMLYISDTKNYVQMLRDDLVGVKENERVIVETSDSYIKKFRAEFQHDPRVIFKIVNPVTRQDAANFSHEMSQDGVYRSVVKVIAIGGAATHESARLHAYAINLLKKTNKPGDINEVPIIIYDGLPNSTSAPVSVSVGKGTAIAPNAEGGTQVDNAGALLKLRGAEIVKYSVPELMQLTPAMRRKALVAAIADRLAPLSSALDRSYEQAKRNPDGSIVAPLQNSTERFKQDLPHLEELLKAIENGDYGNMDDPNTVKKVISYLHSYPYDGIKGLPNASGWPNKQGAPIGSEHDFFNLIDVVAKRMEIKGMPSHGMTVGLGTLLNSYAYGKMQGDSDGYHRYKAAMQKIGMATTMSEWNTLNVSRELIIETLKEVAKGNPQYQTMSVLRDYLNKNGTDAAHVQKQIRDLIRGAL